MEGVIILNTITKEIHAGSLWGLGCVVALIIIVAGILLIIASIKELEPSLFGYGLILLIFGALVIIISYKDYGPIIDYNYSYEAIIQDGVDFNEFNKKYEIINQRGSIYTIVERDTN